jgi:hypothetical protein
MNAKEFKDKTGYTPNNDDLNRVNCPYAGEVGHKNCGWCDKCNKPMFNCHCPAPGKIVFDEQGKVMPDISDVEFYNQYKEA